MPIVKMDHLTVVGLAEEQESIIEALMNLGAIEIIRQSDEKQVQDSTQEPRSVDEQIAFAQNSISRLSKIIDISKKISAKKKPMFSVHRQVTSGDFIQISGRAQQIMDQVRKFEHNLARQEELLTQQHRLESANLLLEPWKDLEIDLSSQDTEHTRLFLGSLDTVEQLKQLEQMLKDDAPDTVIQTLANTEISQLCIIATWRPNASFVQASLRRVGFNPLPFQGEKGTPGQLLSQNITRLQAIESDLAQLKAENSELAELVHDFETVHDYYAIRHDRLQEVARLAGTRSTFWLQGWVPSHLIEALIQGLNSRFLVAAESRPAGPQEEFPILLKNNRLVKPFEVVTEMFSPPANQESDPTPWIAPFYFFFFGIMLSDVGYGLILSGISALLLYKFKVGGELKKISRLLFVCGIAATIWGFLFGGFFGDMLSVLSGQKIILPALWFNPMDNPTALMIWSLVFGVVHIFAGMWVKALYLFRTGHGLDAVLDIFPWYFIIIGLGLMIGKVGGSIGSILALTGAATILLFGGRGTRNPLLRLFKGAFALYNISAYFSDILSYTRILALVLATSVIAMVVNLMGFLVGPSIPGVLIFIVVAVFGHGLNLALSTLSAYVHTSRLHYVEFFGKFYEGGGRTWQPLRPKTKFIEIRHDS